MSSSNKYHFKFYDWEEKLRDKPFLRQPFGDNWEVYTWGEAGLMARKLATGLKSLGLEKGSHIGLKHYSWVKLRIGMKLKMV